MNNKIQQYVDEKYNLLESYIDTVINEKVPIGQYEKKGVELFLKYKDKYIYKPEAVKKVIKFFYLLRINNKNKYERFPLLDFQVFWLAALYGLYKTDTERLIKRCYLTQAKKNGKSSFSAGLALYEQIYDGELDASIVVLASSKEQATVVLDYIKAMIANSPELPELNVQRNSIFYNYKNTICKITVRAADSDKLQGINPSFSIIDEFGAHPSALLADRAFSAVSSRINPLQVIITTAYHNKDKSPAYELEQTAKNILDGIVEDDSFFCQVFSLDNPEEEFHKPELYRKANPALGKTVNPAILESSYKQSLLLPSKKHNFLTDNLNVWVDNKIQWLSDDIVKKAMVKDKTIPMGADVYLGADLSATRDLTSIFVLYYNEPADEFIGEVYYIFPDNPEKKIRKGSVNLTVWIEQGFIIQTTEKAILDADILEVIKEIKGKYNIISVGIDPWMVQRLKISIENNLNLQVNPVPQNIKHLSTPLKEIEKNIIMQKLWLPQNPVLRWNFRNAVIANYSGNIKLLKDKGEAIDGLIAMNISMHEYLAYNFSYMNQAYDEFINSEYMKGSNEQAQNK